jgi:hypothetical protein
LANNFMGVREGHAGKGRKKERKVEKKNGGG